MSGLVLALLERPPEPGDSVEFRGVRFMVEAISGHGVASCIVDIAAPEPDVFGKDSHDREV